MGPLRRRWSMSSQFVSRKKGCALTRAEPPLMLPRRRERSTVQSERMMSLASSERGGSWGKTTGFSRILERNQGEISFLGEERVIDSLFVDLDGVLVPERWVACQELIHQDAQGPPVHSARMALVLYHLGSQILGGPAEGICLNRAVVFVVPQALREAKVD